MADEILKRCTLCGETKSGACFSARSKSKDGLYSWCKPCSAERTRAWAAKNVERVAQANKARYWAAPEAARASRTAYYRAKTGGGPAKPAQTPQLDELGQMSLHCGKCDKRKPVDEFYRRAGGKFYTPCKQCATQRNSEYANNNAQRVTAYKKQWHAENSDRINAEKRAAFDACDSLRAKRAALALKWAEENPEKRAAIAQNYKHRRRAQEDGGITSRELLAWKRGQKKVCHWCKKKCADNYHIDHIQPLARGGKHIAENLCVACPTCNLRKNARDPIEFAQSLGLLL